MMTNASTTIDVAEVIDALSERGKVEWELAVAKVSHTALIRDLEAVTAERDALAQELTNRDTAHVKSPPTN